MSKGSKVESADVARSLYGSGVPLGEIAASLELHHSTVARWRASAAGTPRDWDTLRQARKPNDPLLMVRRLEARIDAIACDPNIPPGLLADSVSKLARAVEILQSRFEDPDLAIGLFQRFAAFVQSRYGADPKLRDALGEALDAFLDTLQRVSHESEAEVDG